MLKHRKEIFLIIYYLLDRWIKHHMFAFLKFLPELCIRNYVEIFGNIIQKNLKVEKSRNLSFNIQAFFRCGADLVLQKFKQTKKEIFKKIFQVVFSSQRIIEKFLTKEFSKNLEEIKISLLSFSTFLNSLLFFFFNLLWYSELEIK